MIRWAIRKIFGLLVAAVVILALSLVIAKALGGGAYTVLSGSMEPEYHVGSLIYVRPVDADKLKEGDVITYAISDEATATHRIVDVEEDSKDGSSERRFITKGDANDTEDATPVSEKNILGKPLFSIPYAGYIVTYIRKPLGRFIDL